MMASLEKVWKRKIIPDIIFFIIIMQDCVTRWGSKQRMVDRILEQAQAIRRVQADDRRRAQPTLSWQDVEVLESVNKALKPIANFTDIMSGESYVTVSSLLPMLQLLKEDILTESADDTELTANIKSRVLTQLEAKYDLPSTQEILRMSTILDPRYRGERIEQDMLGEMKKKLQEEMVTLWRKSQPVRIRVEEEEETEDVQPQQQAAAPPPSKKMTLGSLLGKGRNPAILSPEERAETEVTAYLREPVIEGEDDPLAWWRSNHTRFPLMAKVSRKYLCICATSTSSERLFSTAGNIVTPQRSLLKPEKVDMLVFLAKNA